jgi:hypothetical protein
LLGRPEGNGQLERPGHRREDDIKMDLGEMEWEAWTGLSCLKIRIGGRLF